MEKFLEFFAARIANRRTRAAYGRAVGQFLAWCEARGLALTAVSPLHVAAYIRTHPGSAPTVKQHLAASRMLGDWLVVSQVIPVNPAAAVRGPTHVVTTGATPMLSPAEARRLLEAIDPGTLTGRRDRALVSVMLYSVARVSAVIGMRRQDYFRQERQGWLRLHEKGGTRHDVPAHHRAAEALDDYLARAGLDAATAALFQSVDPAGRRLTGRTLSRRLVLAMIKRRAAAAALLRQSVYSRLAGYEDLNDAVRVSADPTFRLIGSPKLWDRGAALTSTLHWFETELLTQAKNLVGLRAVNREVLAQAEMATRADRVVLDMDSSESPVHGAQEGSAYNGHFESVCYHPLFLFTEHGDCLGATLRPGNVHSADDWDTLLLPEIDRQQAEGKRVAFRADAAFAKPEIYDALEQRDVDYAIRMPANKSVELEIEDILFRLPGRPSRKPLVRYKSFRYQAKSWTTPRRIVAKVEHHRGELFPRVGFIVTSMVLPSRSVVRFYNTRGTAEQWIKESKQATHWTRLSCHRFRANEVRLQLSVLAYNLGNLWRRLVLPPRIKCWSLTSLQQRLVKTGGRLVKHARYYWLLLAEGHLTRRLFGDMLRRIWALPVPAG